MKKHLQLHPMEQRTIDLVSLLVKLVRTEDSSTTIAQIAWITTGQED